MLRKLYKHEFIALYRILLPLYAVLFGLSGLLKLLSLFDTSKFAVSLIFNLISTLTIILAIGLMFAGFVLVIVNFYKSLLGKQGYLTFSLPFKASAHIICKLICGVISMITGVLAEILALFIILYDNSFIKNLLSELKYSFIALKNHFGLGKFILVSAEILFIIIFSLCANLLMFFASMSLGQLFKNKILGSVVSYFGIYAAIQIIGIIFAIVLAATSGEDIFSDSSVSLFAISQGFIIYILVIEIIEGAAFFFTSNHFLSKKLNLE